jgi:hypothetical protein
VATCVGVLALADLHNQKIVAVRRVILQPFFFVCNLSICSGQLAGSISISDTYCLMMKPRKLYAAVELYTQSLPTVLFEDLKLSSKF